MSQEKPYKILYPYEIRQGYGVDEHYVLMLAEPKSMQVVPMLIGPAEAQSMMLAQEHQPTLRPTTHQLMMKTLEEYGLTLNRVAIERFEEGIFYANLYVGDGFNEKTIDSRSSDAVTLALLAGCNILVAENVLEETAVAMETLESKSPQPEALELEALEQLLHQYEEAEEYEKAAEVLKEIEKRKGIES